MVGVVVFVGGDCVCFGDEGCGDSDRFFGSVIVCISGFIVVIICFICGHGSFDEDRVGVVDCECIVVCVFNCESIFFVVSGV